MVVLVGHRSIRHVYFDALLISYSLFTYEIIIITIINHKRVIFVVSLLLSTKMLLLVAFETQDNNHNNYYKKFNFTIIEEGKPKRRKQSACLGIFSKTILKK